MKVALLMPNLNASPQTLELGLAYLATYIAERTHHEVRIIDVTFHARHWKRHVRTQLEEFKPDVIGVSILSVYFEYAKDILKHIRKYCDVPIIAGGYQAAMLPDETIAVPEIDAICTGEGELTLAEYLSRLEKGESLEGCQGVWFKSQGRVIKNPDRPVIADLDSLPAVNWDLFPDLDKYLYYLQRLYFIGTRGCPYRCAFCAETALASSYRGKRYRERDPRSYAREIRDAFEKYRSRGMRAAHLFDAVFSYNEEWLREFTDEYRKIGLSETLPYTVFARPDAHNANEVKLRLLAESGCHQVRFGVESASDAFREKEIRKFGCKSDTMFELFEKCNSLGMIVKTFAILGFPGDTQDRIRATYRFCQDPRIQVSFFLSYTPIPGTPMAKATEKLGGMNTSRNNQKYSFHFSRGVRNPGVPSWFVPWMLLRSYAYYGTKIAWLSFRARPWRFLPTVLPRILLGFYYRIPIQLSALYAIINPVFWPGICRNLKAR